ncbi:MULTISPECIES: hypothetical protein [unclassified Microbacterium]|uniref:hypothetical protein n=1 Tax=unclassified Microbacterium TaxID=2609290 RepID=UPI000B1B00D1|nr:MULTISPECIES: hypothetical protein [unclassified Microbacterium]MBD8206303.1 hypothetical protein [Microbacterium sp. CFBP 8801]MBD8220037.1 hypothetical protein [Microbacterium sp. CFBP 13617]MBD8478238.1 hypothetical protein [Microbacterium sp. CFBP 8794]MBD8508501.1 hypothetical protein [Microbacterium sp. CFBP 8790]
MTRRRVWQIVMLLAPLAALIVVVAVLRGAGVPLSVPGVIVVLVLLVVARVVVGRLRRRRPK